MTGSAHLCLTAHMSDEKWHGTRTGYTYHKCRCEACTKANRDYQRAATARRKTRTPPDSVHGTTGGYSNWGCRCEACSAVYAEHNAKGYHSRQLRGSKGEIPDNVRHGALSTYNTWKCRCDPCREVRNLARKNYCKQRMESGDLTHGKASTYNIGCRCDECRTAENAYQRERYARKKAQNS